MKKHLNNLEDYATANTRKTTLSKMKALLKMLVPGKENKVPKVGIVLTVILSCPYMWVNVLAVCSVWKSGYETRKNHNQTRPGLIRTATTVWSVVHHNFENLKTEQRPVLTGLNWSFKLQVG